MLEENSTNAHLRGGDEGWGHGDLTLGAWRDVEADLPHDGHVLRHQVFMTLPCSGLYSLLAICFGQK